MKRCLLSLFPVMNVLAFACAGNASQSRDYTRYKDSGQNASIAGTVMLGENPVSYYGVTITSSYLDLMYPAAKEIRNRDGLFILPNLGQGIYDIIVAGPGFARVVIPRVVVKSGQETSLGTLTVSRGKKVTGTVTDDNANAVANATVAIRPRATSFEITDDLLTALAHGVYTTHTDALGRFEILDYAPLDLEFENSQISASVGRRLNSGPYYVRDSARIDLRVLETGNIDGIIPRTIGRYSAVVARPLSHEHASVNTTVASDGSFQFVGLPAGDYQLILLGSEKHVVNVSVARGASATVDFSILSDD